MPSLIEQLRSTVPDLLSSDPAQAKTGRAICNEVRPRLEGEYAENSILQTLSELAKDATSPIARRVGRHGYYRRTDSRVGSSEGTGSPPGPADTAPRTGREAQPEEKFRSFFSRYSREELGLFPKSIEHTVASRAPAGINKWKYPDVVVLEWDSSILSSGDGRLDPARLRVRQNLGEQSFRLQSIELKVEIQASTLRESFFQCVSNSKWAHEAVLAVAAPVTDEAVLSELQRLGSSYAVSVITFGLDRKTLDSWPSASDISSCQAIEFDRLIQSTEINVLVSAPERPSIDWDHLNDLCVQNSEFVSLIDWIDECVRSERARQFESFSAQ